MRRCVWCGLRLRCWQRSFCKEHRRHALILLATMGDGGR